MPTLLPALGNRCFLSLSFESLRKRRWKQYLQRRKTFVVYQSFRYSVADCQAMKKSCILSLLMLQYFSILTGTEKDASPTLSRFRPDKIIHGGITHYVIYC